MLSSFYDPSCSKFIRNSICILLLGVLSIASQAQVLFETTLITPLEATAVRHATVLPDQSIVIAGTHASGDQFPRRKSYVYRYDEQQNLLDSFTFQWAGSLHTDLVQAYTDKATDHVTLVAKSSGSTIRSTGDERLHLIELDEQLRPIRNEQRFDADSLDYQDYEVLPDGGLLSTAYAVNASGHILNIVTIRHSSDLQVQWKRTEARSQGSFSPPQILKVGDSTSLVFSNSNKLTTIRNADGSVVHRDTLNAELRYAEVAYTEARGIPHLASFDAASNQFAFFRQTGGSWIRQPWPSTNVNITGLYIDSLGPNTSRVSITGFGRVLHFELNNDVPASSSFRSERSATALGRSPFQEAQRYLPLVKWQGQSAYVGYHELRGKPQAGVYAFNRQSDEKTLLTITDTSFVDEATYARLLPLAGDSMLVLTRFTDRRQWTHTQSAGYIVAPNGDLVEKDTLWEIPADRYFLGTEIINGGFGLLHSSKNGYLYDMNLSIYDSRGSLVHDIELDSLPYSGSFKDKLSLGTDGFLHAFVDPNVGPRVFVIDPIQGTLERTVLLQNSSGTAVDLIPKYFCVLADGGYLIYSGVSNLFRFDNTGLLIESSGLGTSQNSQLPNAMRYDPVLNQAILEASDDRVYLIDLSNGISIRTTTNSSGNFISIEEKNDFTNLTPVATTRSFNRDSLVNHIRFMLPNDTGRLEQINESVVLTRASTVDYLVIDSKLYLLRRTPIELGDALSLVVVSLNGSSTSTSEQQIQDPLLVYPNPTRRVLNVELDKAEIASAMLFDPVGRLVIERDFTATKSAQLSIPKIASGTYTLVLFDTSGEVYTRQVVIAN